MATLTLEQQRAGGKASAQKIKRDLAELAKLREWFAEVNAKEALKQTAEQHAAEPIDISRVRERLDKIDSLMAEAQDDKSWDTLSRAYERMFKVWMVLTKTPFSGSLKPSTPRQAQRSATVEPIGPAPVAPALPDSGKPA